MRKVEEVARQACARTISNCCNITTFSYYCMFVYIIENVTLVYWNKQTLIAEIDIKKC